MYPTLEETMLKNQKAIILCQLLFVKESILFSLISISRSLEFGIMVLFLKQSILILYFEKNQFNIGAKTVLNSLELM